MSKQDARGSVGAEVPGIPMDHAASHIDLFEIDRNQISRTRALETLAVETGGLLLAGDHALKGAQRHDVREMGVAAIAVTPEGAKHENIGFHRMRREDRHHLETLDVVPFVEDEVPDVEEVGEVRFFHSQQGRQFLLHRRAHQRRREIADAPAGAHQRGQSGEVVIVRVGVKNAVHLADADAQRLQGLYKIRAGVDQIDTPLIGDDADMQARSTSQPSPSPE